MKVGIYTFHAIDNFGAQLQCFATQEFLSKNGYDVEVVNLFTTTDERRVNYRNKWNTIKNVLLNIYTRISPFIRRKIKNNYRFHHFLHLSKRYYTSIELRNNPPQYDVHLVGSDQVWNVEKGLKSDNPYFLDYLPSGSNKMSYASSFGNPTIKEESIPKVSECLNDFKYLSTREEGGAELIEKVTGRRAQIVLDPTFLLSSDDWSRYEESEPLINGPYVLCYGFIKSDEWARIIKDIRETLNIPIVAISISVVIPYKVDRFYQAAGPGEFLNLIRHASLVLTGSFHGMAFSLNFKKDFIVVKQGSRMSRMQSLLQRFNLRDRIIENMEQSHELITKSLHVNYTEVTPIIEKEIKKSSDWLLTSLEKLGI